MAQKWDYDLIIWDSGSFWIGESGEAGLKAMLITKGAEGWELVAVTDRESGYSFFFKRPAVVWSH